MSRAGVYFLSHESPLMWETESPARSALIALGQSLPKPKAVLFVSPHWLTRSPVVSVGETPETIHDFGGFAEHLYEIKYPAPGSKEIAIQVLEALKGRGLDAYGEERGFDHATWLVCGLMWPAADVPIVQLSIQPHRSPEDHYRMGQALQALSLQGVMVIASGTWTHNLRELFQNGLNEAAPVHESVVAFSDWMIGRVLQNDVTTLLDYANLAPDASKHHPTADHILGLFVALGAAEGRTPELLHRSVMYGSLAMVHIGWV